MKGPCRWKTPRVITSHPLSRGDGHSDLGGFFTRNGGNARKSRSRKEPRRRSASRARGRGDRGVRGSIGLLAPWEENAHAPSSRTRSQDGTAGREARWQARCPVAVHRSGRECRETLGPPVKSTEPKTPWSSTRNTQSQNRGVSREHTRYRYTFTFRWQKSVVRIARLALSNCAGRKACWRGRALARRKLESLA